MKVVVRTAGKKGKGVFATESFKKGQVVLKWDYSHKVKRMDVKRLSQHDKAHLNYAGNGEYIIMAYPEKYVNHSCNPNTYVKNEKDIALRDIKKGEEITTDYSAGSMDDWRMECHCKSKNCRKIIEGDFRKLDTKMKKRLHPFLQDWFRSELSETKK